MRDAHATFMQHLRSICTTLMQHWCNTCATAPRGERGWIASAGSGGGTSGLAFAGAEDVAARLAAVAGVVVVVEPVEAGDTAGAAGGAPDGAPRGERRDRWPVAALHAVDIALERRVHVAPAAGARLEQDHRTPPF